VADQPSKPRFSRTQVDEATAGAVLAAAITTTSGGVGWLVVQLPNRLTQMEQRIQRILDNQDQFRDEFNGLEEKVQVLDKRVIKLELGR